MIAPDGARPRRTLADVIAKSFDSDQQAAVFEDYVAAADALTEAKANDWYGLDPDRRAELSSRYNVLLSVCRAAGYSTADLSPHWAPISVAAA